MRSEAGMLARKPIVGPLGALLAPFLEPEMPL